MGEGPENHQRRDNASDHRQERARARHRRARCYGDAVGGLIVGRGSGPIEVCHDR
jgi:hypothetical protein